MRCTFGSAVNSRSTFCHTLIYHTDAHTHSARCLCRAHNNWTKMGKFDIKLTLSPSLSLSVAFPHTQTVLIWMLKKWWLLMLKKWWRCNLLKFRFMAQLFAMPKRVSIKGLYEELNCVWRELCDKAYKNSVEQVASWTVFNAKRMERKVKAKQKPIRQCWPIRLSMSHQYTCILPKSFGIEVSFNISFQLLLLRLVFFPSCWHVHLTKNERCKNWNWWLSLVFGERPIRKETIKQAREIWIGESNKNSNSTRHGVCVCMSCWSTS